MDNTVLYIKLSCALTHDISVCNNCRKCGNTGAECRANILAELSEYMSKDLAWNNQDDDPEDKLWVKEPHQK